MTGRFMRLFLPAAAIVVAFSGPAPAPEAGALPLAEVSVGEVGAVVPTAWKVRPMPSETAALLGMQAFHDDAATSPEEARARLEAYWVDATRVGLPSDYYYLVAEGPAISGLPLRRCRRDAVWEARDHRPALDRSRRSPGDYVATVAGVCSRGGRRTRWASFVAAPGFGPVRSLGIPRSGLYVATVAVADGPWAERRANRLLRRVSFGDTSVEAFLRAAGATA